MTQYVCNGKQDEGHFGLNLSESEGQDYSVCGGIEPWVGSLIDYWLISDDDSHDKDDD